jgi:hypothetical protein
MTSRLKVGMERVFVSGFDEHSILHAWGPQDVAVLKKITYDSYKHNTNEKHVKQLKYALAQESLFYKILVCQPGSFASNWYLCIAVHIWPFVIYGFDIF